jgi:hypothetical protein
MIPAKEKAKELVYKMRNEIPCHCDDLEQAKQCALIAVDEMINLLMTMNKYMMFPEQVEYLQKVKQEIEKL